MPEPRRAPQDTGWAQSRCADGEERAQASSALDRALHGAGSSTGEAIAINNPSPGACCSPCTGALQHEVRVREPTGKAAVKQRAGGAQLA